MSFNVLFVRPEVTLWVRFPKLTNGGWRGGWVAGVEYN